MNCFNHPDVPAAAFCRSCGRPLCQLCQRVADGVIYCPEHAPVTTSSTAVPPPPPPGAWTAPPQPVPSAPASDPANPYVAARPAVPPFSSAGASATAASPGLAFVLGLIPGVGAIYNGQYVKGLVHAAIFGMLLTISQGSGGPDSPFVVMSTVAFYTYMPFEAFHTARKRQMGLPVEEWSSLMTQKAPALAVPVGPIILILVGVLFLLNSLNVLDMRAVVRFWPVVLILIGIGMLVRRVRDSRIASQPKAAAFDAATMPETARER